MGRARRPMRWILAATAALHTSPDISELGGRLVLRPDEPVKVDVLTAPSSKDLTAQDSLLGKPEPLHDMLRVRVCFEYAKQNLLDVEVVEAVVEQQYPGIRTETATSVTLSQIDAKLGRLVKDVVFTHAGQPERVSVAVPFHNKGPRVVETPNDVGGRPDHGVWSKQRQALPSVEKLLDEVRITFYERSK